MYTYVLAIHIAAITMIVIKFVVTMRLSIVKTSVDFVVKSTRMPKRTVQQGSSGPAGRLDTPLRHRTLLGDVVKSVSTKVAGIVLGNCSTYRGIVKSDACKCCNCTALDCGNARASSARPRSPYAECAHMVFAASSHPWELLPDPGLWKSRDALLGSEPPLRAWRRSYFARGAWV